MSFIVAIVVSLILVFLFGFIGHIVTKELKLGEENKLLSHLIKIALGGAAFLIVINLAGNILKDFNWALILTFLVIIALATWKNQETISVFKKLNKSSVKEFFSKIKQSTDKYFWILIGVINFIYGITAFSTTKLDHFGLPSGHVFTINQLLAGTYPPKYSFLPNLAQKYHYGADILGAIVSKFSNCHPEISLDVLLIVFLNLSFLALYALAIKFCNSSPVNKYLVPFAAFLAWGPITNLFIKNPGENIPQKFLEKIQYLTQSRLIDAAQWSGLVLHWFFAPPIGIGIFFFLIALYLVYNFLDGKKGYKSLFILAIFLSSLVIIDITKFIVVIAGLLIYIIFKASELIFEEPKSIAEKDLQFSFKSFGVLFVVILVLCLIHENWFTFNKAFVPLMSFYKFGTTNLPSDYNPVKASLILLIIFSFGYYLANKQKNNWVSFLIPYFIVSMVTPFLFTIPNAGIGKLFMAGNYIGAFAVPLTIDFVKNKFNFKEQKLTVFYIAIFILLSFSTFMFWAFGDKTKPTFLTQGGKLKFSGKQVFPYKDNLEEMEFAKNLRSNKFKNSTILSEPMYGGILTVNSGLFGTWPIIGNFYEENPIKKEVIDSVLANFNSLFTLNSKLLQGQRIRILYLTPKLVRYILSPKARQVLLATELNGGGKLIYSNNKDLAQLKETYFIDPKKLTYDSVLNYGKKLKKYLKSANLKNNHPMYLKQIAECPYFGIYNAMSNDFDGDKISDIAFFDYNSKKWTTIYGKDLQEEEVDLNSSIFANYNGNLFTPVPSDYDGDGKTDIAFFNENNGTWNILQSSNLQVDSSKQFGILIEELPLPAYLDEDLKTDLSCFNANHGTWYSGTTTKGTYSNNFGLSPLDIPAFADVDGDKQADYIIYKPDTKLLEVYLSTKSFDKSDHLKLIIGNNNARLIPGDYDGDKKVDLAVWTPESGEWEIAYAKDLLTAKSKPQESAPFIGCGATRQLNEDSQPCLTKIVKLGNAGDIPIPGDYNGDGKTEIAIYHISIGQLEILLDGEVKKKIDLSKYKNLTPVSFIGV
ncbi:MAG: VCBS repeat-containing protein [Candidatus Melainabacteria bacterium]|nr:VCBS repeat-containing protein [Candidatus Melainabacteria bacterium]